MVTEGSKADVGYKYKKNNLSDVKAEIIRTSFFFRPPHIRDRFRKYPLAVKMKWTSITQFALGLVPMLALIKLTPSQAGVHAIYSYLREEPPEHFYGLVKRGKVGGIALHEENVHDGLPGIINKTREL